MLWETDEAMSKLIGIRVSEGIDEILGETAERLGKKKSVLARELMEQRLFELSLVSSRLKRR